MLIDLLTSDESHLVGGLVWVIEDAVLPEKPRKSIEHSTITSPDEVFISMQASRKKLDQACFDV
jgi:hypothetical protein